MHSNDRWRDVDPAFAEIVWRHPGAPLECIQRYGGVTSGIWRVHLNQF
jgi:hypothetical protein